MTFRWAVAGLPGIREVAPVVRRVRPKARQECGDGEGVQEIL